MRGQRDNGVAMVTGAIEKLELGRDEIDPNLAAFRRSLLVIPPGMAMRFLVGFEDLIQGLAPELYRHAGLCG